MILTPGGRGMGCHPDPPGRYLTSARRVVGADAPPDVALELAAYLPPVRDQGPRSSCLGSWAEHLTAQVRAAGLDLPLPFSADGVYRLTRCVDRESPHVPLVDGGGYPNQAARAIEEWGLATVDDWPNDLATVNDEPTIDELNGCARLTKFAPRRIFGEGFELEVDVRRALGHRMPVGFAIEVDDGFENYAGGELGGDFVGQFRGRHWVWVWGVDFIRATGEHVYMLRNSWGESYGVDGEARVTGDFLRRRAQDPYLAEVLP